MKSAKREQVKKVKFDNLVIRMNRHLFCHEVGASRYMVLQDPFHNIGYKFTSMFDYALGVFKGITNIGYQCTDKLPSWPKISNRRGLDYSVVNIDATCVSIYFKDTCPAHIVCSRLGRHFHIENRNANIGSWPNRMSEYNSRAIVELPGNLVPNSPYDETTQKSVSFNPNHLLMSKRDLDMKAIDDLSKPEPKQARRLIVMEDMDNLIPGFIDYNAKMTKFRELQRTVEYYRKQLADASRECDNYWASIEQECGGVTEQINSLKSLLKLTEV
ncbi:hypothetical protein [Aeromonas phage phiWae14]|nr:hypothetical protein [Aeromonas phage phiWae14]